MNEHHYLEKVKTKPRVFWNESGISLATMKRNTPKRVTGYLIRSKGHNKVVVVSDYVLNDKYALRRLAMESSHKKLAGWLVLDRDRILYQPPAI